MTIATAQAVPEALVVTSEKVVLALQTMPPSWVTYLSALLTPAVALLAVAVAVAQWRIAKRKLQLDLFDRRYEMYTVVQHMFSRMLLDGKADTASFGEFENAVFGSRWLFNDRVSQNLATAFKVMRKINELTARIDAFHLQQHGPPLAQLQSDVSKRQETLRSFRDATDKLVAPDLQLSVSPCFLLRHLKSHASSTDKG